MKTMSTATASAATKEQLDDIRYLLALLESRGHTLDETRAAMNKAWLAHSFDVNLAADMIKMLLDARDNTLGNIPAQRTTDQFARVPDGRYAVLNDAGEYAFYRVKRNSRGVPVVHIQLSSTFHSLPRDVEYGVLRKIAADPQQACTDYGLKLGVCGRCSLPLTNPDSRARGMGDICASKPW
jgi:hypothetical protein